MTAGDSKFTVIKCLEWSQMSKSGYTCTQIRPKIGKILMCKEMF